jgi:hypothetical protein
MQSYNVYDIDFLKLPCQVVSRPNRKPLFMVVVKAALYPFIFLHNHFTTYRKAKIYQLTITSQVVYLERLLNDRYDSTQRRIFIDDAIEHEPLFIYQEAELKPVFMYLESEASPQFLYTDGEAGEAKDDFVVFVPIDAAFTEIEMRSLIDSYRLTGTKYTIQKF